MRDLPYLFWVRRISLNLTSSNCTCCVKGTMTEPKNKDPLQGITLERIVTDLHAKYGWEFLAGKVSIRCFRENPSITSSLKFLRKTPWARAKVERLYLRLISRSGVKRSRTYTAKK